MQAPDSDQVEEPQALTDALAVAKMAFNADPSPENREAKLVAGRALADWRNSSASGRSDGLAVAQTKVGVFRGADAEAFAPESEGGDDARALELIAGVMATRGESGDPAEALAKTRKNY